MHSLIYSAKRIQRFVFHFSRQESTLMLRGTFYSFFFLVFPQRELFTLPQTKCFTLNSVGVGVQGHSVA